MEPSRRNQWQPVANRLSAETAKSSAIRCRGLPLVAATQNGKEGVGGSSPPEGSRKALQNGAFSFSHSGAFPSWDVDVKWKTQLSEDLSQALPTPERAFENPVLRSRERECARKCQVLRTRRPTGLDGVTLTSTAFGVKPRSASSPVSASP
jgi:hypothetical protein